MQFSFMSVKSSQINVMIDTNLLVAEGGAEGGTCASVMQAACNAVSITHRTPGRLHVARCPPPQIAVEQTQPHCISAAADNNNNNNLLCKCASTRFLPRAPTQPKPGQASPGQARPNPTQVQLRRCCLHFVTLVSCGDSVKWQFWVLLSLFASLLRSEGCLKSWELRVVHLLWKENFLKRKNKAANTSI